MTQELRKLCDQVRQLAEKIRKNLARRAPDTPSKAVALYMFAKGYKSYQAALLLFRESFWQDAASVARTVLELSFQAKWLDKDPQTAGKLFLRGVDRDRLKLMKNLKLNADEETRCQAHAILRDLLSSNNIDASWRNWWGTQSSIETLAKDVGCERVYGLQYRPLSWFVHSSPLSIRYFLADNKYAVDCKPCAPPENDKGFAETCFSTAPGALMDILAVVDNVFALHLQKDFDRIGSAFRKYNEVSLAAEENTDKK